VSAQFINTAVFRLTLETAQEGGPVPCDVLLLNKNVGEEYLEYGRVMK
jgi:hypothetical protein